jgi:Rap1a immunity proteins
MRALAIILVSLIFWQAHSYAQTLGELKENCEKLETSWRLVPQTSQRVPANAGAAMCWGYLSAFSQLTLVVGGVNPDCSMGNWGPRCWPALHVCFPQGTTMGQILDAFLAEARSHQGDWHQPAYGHLLNAMIDAFPCKGEFSPAVPNSK